MTNGITVHGKEYPVIYTRDIVGCYRCALDPNTCRKICLFFSKPSKLWEKPIFKKPE